MTIRILFQRKARANTLKYYGHMSRDKTLRILLCYAQLTVILEQQLTCTLLTLLE